MIDHLKHIINHMTVISFALVTLILTLEFALKEFEVSRQHILYSIIHFLCVSLFALVFIVLCGGFIIAIHNSYHRNQIEIPLLIGVGIGYFAFRVKEYLSDKFNKNRPCG